MERLCYHCTPSEHRHAIFALWINLVVYFLAFPAILVLGVEIRHWQMSTLRDPVPILFTFASIAILNAGALWAAYRSPWLDEAVPAIKVALYADALWQAIDLIDWLLRHFGQPLRWEFLAPLPDLILCVSALWRLPVTRDTTWIA